MKKAATALSAVLFLAPALPPAVRASNVRVDAFAMEDYVADPERDLDLNPAFAALAAENLFFAGASMDYSASTDRETTFQIDNRTRHWEPSVQAVRRGERWNAAFRYNPSFLSTHRISKVITGGVVTAVSPSSQRTAEPLSGRIILARPGTRGGFGFGVEGSKSSFVSSTLVTRVEGDGGVFRVTGGAVSGTRGGTTSAWSAEFTEEKSDRRSASAIQVNDTKTRRLRGWWILDRPSAAGAFRAVVELDHGATEIRYDATNTVEKRTEDLMYARAGAGMAWRLDPKTTFFTGAETWALVRSRIIDDFRAFPDIEENRGHLYGNVRLGLEREVSPRFVVRGRADALHWNYYHAGYSTGPKLVVKGWNGPFVNVAGGFGLRTGKRSFLDVFLSPDVIDQSVNTQGPLKDTSRHFQAEATWTLRFSGSEGAGGKRRRA